MRLLIELSDEQIDVIARRAAELVLERIEIPEPSPEPSPWLTVDEAAEYLRCRRQRVYDLLSSGRLARYKEGGRVLIARSEIMALVAPERALAPAERVRSVA